MQCGSWPQCLHDGGCGEWDGYPPMTLLGTPNKHHGPLCSTLFPPGGSQDQESAEPRNSMSTSFFFFPINLFGSAESQLWHKGFLIFLAACRIFNCGMWDLVPLPGFEPGATALGAQNLSHQKSPPFPHLYKPIFLYFYVGQPLCPSFTD